MQVLRKLFIVSDDNTYRGRGRLIQYVLPQLFTVQDSGVVCVTIGEYIMVNKYIYTNSYLSELLSHHRHVFNVATLKFCIILELLSTG